MSDSNCGSRKNPNIKDHLYVVHGLVNDVINGEGEATAIQIYDITKCFDAMDFRRTMNNLYDVNVINDNFSLLCEVNKTAKIAVKTPVGLTERFEVEEKVMQGGSWGPLQCSVQMDKMGKE